MYGWRGKLGLLVPSTNTVMEGDFWRLAPAGVSVHTARMRHDLALAAEERLVRMAEHTCEVVGDLAAARVGAILYGCTSGSFFFGRERDADHCAELAQLASRPVLSTSQAMVEAARALGLRRLCVVTPYSEDLSGHLPGYLAEHGLEVLAMRSLPTNLPAQITPEQVFDLARQAWRPDADGLFVSCTGLPILELIAPLEEDLGRPVVAANQASFWGVLGRAGLAATIKGFGELLELPPPRATEQLLGLTG
jgi:maleate isomerase